MQEPRRPAPPPGPHREEPEPEHCERKTPSGNLKAPPPPPHRRSESSGDFWQRLLPKDFDTGDLLVAAMLLLMAGDNPESKNTALLTLAMYFML